MDLWAKRFSLVQTLFLVAGFVMVIQFAPPVLNLRLNPIIKMMARSDKSSSNRSTQGEVRVKPHTSRIGNVFIEEVYNGTNPWNTFARHNNASQFVKKDYPYASFNVPSKIVRSILEFLQPQVILEVGSFFGDSSKVFAHYIKNAASWDSNQSGVICVDSFSGTVDGWAAHSTNSRNSYGWMGFDTSLDGSPTIYNTFMANILTSGHEDVIIPLRTTSSVGMKLFKLLRDQRRIEISDFPSLIYLDSSHEPHETFLEVQLAYSILQPGGVLMGHDWNWPSVSNDVVRFAQQSMFTKLDDSFVDKLLDVMHTGLKYEQNVNGVIHIQRTIIWLICKK